VQKYIPELKIYQRTQINQKIEVLEFDAHLQAILCTLASNFLVIFSDFVSLWKILLAIVH
jgi:hypothetical protein